MSRTEKHAYIRAVRPRYQRCGRKDRGVILREVSLTLGCHRKSAERLLSSRRVKASPRKQAQTPAGIGRPPRNRSVPT